MSEDSRKEEQGQESTFKVTDRRMFTTEGELREEAGPKQFGSDSSPAPGEAPPQQRQSAQEPILESPGKEAEDRGAKGEEVNFASFVLSLATTAMLHLGEIPDPATGQPGQNMEAAKQMIDILAMLQTKTEGNRDSEENQLLDSLLYELRMKYLSKTKAINL